MSKLFNDSIKVVKNRLIEMVLFPTDFLFRKFMTVLSAQPLMHNIFELLTSIHTRILKYERLESAWVK